MKTLKLLLTMGSLASMCSTLSLFLFIGTPPLFLNAQTVYWDFSNGSRSGTSSVNYISPLNASTGPGVSTSGFPDEACSNSEPWSVRGWYNTNSIFEARQNGDYVSFSLSVDAGESFHITGISFRSNRSVNTGGNEFGPNVWVMYSSHNNYSSIIMSGRNTAGTTGSSASCDFHSQSVDIPLQGGTSITFRIYAYSGASNEITTMRFDDFIVEGTQLPIGLSYFDVREENQEVQLYWRTKYEKSNAYIAVERSGDGYQFREIGRVSGNGTTDYEQDYIYIDEKPLSGLNYYRLRQVDFDGTDYVHHVVSIRVRSVDDRTRFFPTIATDHLTIHHAKTPEQQGNIYIYNTLGRMVRKVEVPQGSILQQFSIDDLIAGTYIVQYIEGRNKEVLGCFVKH